MSDWPLVAIGELAVRVGSGVTPTGGSDVYTDSGVVFLRSQNVANGGLLLDDVAFIASETHRRMAASEVFPFDVLLNITGASIGRCCYLPEGLGQANVNQHVCAIRLPKPDLCDAKFLASMLASPIGQRQIVRLNAGGNREGLNYQQLRAFRVPWPSRHHREAIAEILSTLDEAIERTEGLIGKLQQIKAGLMYDLFTRGVTPAGHLRPPRDQAPHLYKHSPLGWIPNEWEMKPCSEICEKITVGIVVRPTQYYASEGVPAFRSANIRKSGIDASDMVFISPQANTLLAKSQVQPGDIITVRTGYPGTTAVVPKEFAGANCIDILISRPSSVVRADFLAHWINSSFGKDQVLRKQGGLAQQHFNVGELRDLLAVVPQMNEQDAIVARIATISARSEAEQCHVAKLRQQKHGLMHDLLTGRVRVPVAAAADGGSA